MHLTCVQIWAFFLQLFSLLLIQCDASSLDTKAKAKPLRNQKKPQLSRLENRSDVYFWEGENTRALSTSTVKTSQGRH